MVGGLKSRRRLQDCEVIRAKINKYSFPSATLPDRIRVAPPAGAAAVGPEREAGRPAVLKGVPHFVRRSEVLVAATSTLWLLATLTLIVFASQFLVETAPRDWRVRYSLIVVIVLTGVIILTRLPLGILNGGGLAHRLLFGLAALLNSVAILMFLFLFSSHGPRESALWRPTRVLIWTVGGTGLLGIVAAGYFGVFVLTGRETEPLWLLQPLSVLLFVATYTATLWFLIRFRQLRSYTDLPK